jgi:transcriptional regulator with PAS, ATPase and Fis domain
VIIVGESGTGKGVFARTVHEQSMRCDGMFIAVNCGAIPDQLMESELFGHAKGAFSGADQASKGLFLEADRGTLFLDEIGELDLTLQAKLLRVLENLRVRRLGALSDRQVNVRIVAATNRDLDEQVSAGNFRADLMYRLKVFQIQIPPLRERADDIPVLAQHFLGQLASRYGRAPLHITDNAFAALAAHDWPGNVRELRNVLERAVLLQRSGVLDASDLALGTRRTPVTATAASGGASVEPMSLDSIERGHLQSALAQCAGNVSKAAKMLGISRDTLRYRMERHGLQR